MNRRKKSASFWESSSFFSKHNLYCYLTTLLIILCLLGCQKEPIEEIEEIEATLSSVPGPTGIYSALVWLPSNWLIVEYSGPEMNYAAKGEQWRMWPDGSQRTKLVLSGPPDCENGESLWPELLPDGRLGYIVECKSDKIGIGKYYMMGIDLESQQTNLLLPYHFSQSFLGTGGFTWNPEMTRGLTSDVRGRYLYEELSWFSASGLERVEFDSSLSFAPAWSPDGKTIAFIAAPEQGLTGMARLKSIFNLYLMNPDGSQIRPLVEDFRNGGTLDWSPDSQSLAILATSLGDFGTEPKSGLWLIDAQTGTRKFIAGGNFAGLAWSPDGQKIATIDHLDSREPLSPQKIVIIEMEPFLTRQHPVD